MFAKLRASGLLTLIFLVVAVFATDVYAKWIYYAPLDPLGTSFNLSIEEFHYAPEQILPDNEYSDLHENHLNTITLVLEHVTYGINADSNKSNVIHDNLSGNGSVLYLNQKINKGNMKFFYDFFTGQDESSHVYFCIEKITDTVYYIYTYSRSDLTQNRVGTDERITAYKTVMEKGDDGIWAGVYSLQGTAKVIEVPNYDFFRYGIDVGSWQKI